MESQGPLAVPDYCDWQLVPYVPVNLSAVGRQDAVTQAASRRLTGSLRSAVVSGDGNRQPEASRANQANLGPFYQLPVEVFHQCMPKGSLYPYRTVSHGFNERIASAISQRIDGINKERIPFAELEYETIVDVMRAFGKDGLAQLKYCDLRGLKFTIGPETGVNSLDELIKWIPHVRELIINNENFSALLPGLYDCNFAKIDNIEKLNIKRGIKDSTVNAIAANCPRLERLDLSFSEIKGLGFIAVAGLSELQELNLCCCSNLMKGEALDSLKKVIKRTQLKRLNLCAQTLRHFYLCKWENRPDDLFTELNALDHPLEVVCDDDYFAICYLDANSDLSKEAKETFIKSLWKKYSNLNFVILEVPDMWATSEED